MAIDADELDARFTMPLLTPSETARHLLIPPSTVYYWLAEDAAGEPLVHRVRSERRGWPSIPFVAVIEAYVLRALRDLNVSKRKIRDAAEVVRQDFDTPYGLATRRMASDGVDIFVEYAGGELHRAVDRQVPIREVIEDHLRYIEWDERGHFAKRLRLRQYPDAAPVIIDPRFGWGTPVLANTKVPVRSVVDLWRAGEPIQLVAEEFELPSDAVEAILRVAA